MPQGPLSTSDVQSYAFQGAVPMTAGGNYAAARSIGFNCSVAGTVTVTFKNGSTLLVTLGAGWQTFPFAVTSWVAGTATTTAVNLL
jgi:hypothetical protein